jgi:UDP-N-acetylglucosamine 4-epimerase
MYNVALGDRTTLNALFEAIRNALVPHLPALAGRRPDYRAFRAGDVRHSQADITKARTRLGYAPTHGVAEGIGEAMDWYRAHLSGGAPA